MRTNSLSPLNATSSQYDLVVVGGAPGGIACAVRAAREGLIVLLVNHNNHLGGILSSGLDVWDTIWEGNRSPIDDELRAGILGYYRKTYGEDSLPYADALPSKTGHPVGKFEGIVAEKIATTLVEREKKIIVLPGMIPTAVKRDGARMESVTFRSPAGHDDARPTDALNPARAQAMEWIWNAVPASWPDAKAHETQRSHANG